MEIKKVITQIQNHKKKKRELFQKDLYSLSDALLVFNEIVGGNNEWGDNKQIIENLLKYYIHSSDSIYDIEKGILLAGFSGGGKSQLMEYLRELCFYLKLPKIFLITSSLEISQSYSNSGFKDLDKYSYNNTINSYGDSVKIPKNYCFDNIGREPNEVVHFGAKARPMEAIIMKRHDLFKKEHIFTSFVTDLDGSGLKKYYDESIYSKMKSMMNFVSLAGDDRK